MKRQIRVWVPLFYDKSGIATYGIPPYYVTFYLSRAAAIRQGWAPRQLVRATLTLDEPKAKKRSKKR